MYYGTHYMKKKPHTILHIPYMYPSSSDPILGCYIERLVKTLGGVSKGHMVCVVKKPCYSSIKGRFRWLLMLRACCKQADLYHAHFGHAGTLIHILIALKLIPKKPVTTTYCGSDILRRYWIAHINRYFSRFNDVSIIQNDEMYHKTKGKRKEIITYGTDTELFRPL